MSMKEVIIVGVNGNCIDIAEAVEALAVINGNIRVLGFLDDAEASQGTNVAGYPVLGRIGDAARFPQAHFVNGIGSPKSYRIKPDIIARVAAKHWATIIHPTAVVSRLAQIGQGTVLLANVSIGANARVGSHCLVLQNSVVSHDTVVGDCTAIASAVCISGGCVIGANAYIGSNVSIRDGIRISAGALIGIGSVVVKDVPAETVAYGNPARIRA
jgi:sugar O-acyltransferase (sialic acid O-acetyltransferase NeuD family)